jgi:magnesium chelatase family protein
MKLSGPLLDRLDIGIEVPATDQATLLAGAEGECSASIKARVEAARGRQIQRQQHTNNQLQNEALDEHCQLSADNTTWLVSAAQKLNWSGRATHRVLRVARTIADLAESTHIEKPHLAEALQLRKLLHLKPSV